MINDGALELSHQGEIVFAHPAGGMDSYKTIIMCWGQTDSSAVHFLILGRSYEIYLSRSLTQP